MIAQEQLTDNTNELKAIVYQLIGVVEEQKLLIANQNERIEAQSLKIEEQAQKIDELTYQVSMLKRHRYGKRSEKLPEVDNPTNEDNAENTDTLAAPDAHVFSSIHRSSGAIFYDPCNTYVHSPHFAPNLQKLSAIFPWQSQIVCCPS